MAKTWKPVDEFVSVACASGAACSIMVERDEDRLTMYSNHAPPVSVELPDNIRLCILTDTEPTIPATKDVVSALDVVLCNCEIDIEYESLGTGEAEMKAAIGLLRKVLADIEQEAQADGS